jgi:hypothetical protein
MTERIDEVRKAMLRLGEPLNGMLSGMRMGKFESCAALLTDAKKRVDALESLVCETPVANQLDKEVKRLSGAIREAAELTWNVSAETEIYKSTIIAVQAARSEFVNALNRLELDLGRQQERSVTTSGQHHTRIERPDDDEPNDD